MAEIRPLRALRYNLEKAGPIENLTCPPYDIISPTSAGNCSLTAGTT